MEEGPLEVQSSTMEALRNHFLFKVHSLNFPGMDSKHQDFLRFKYCKVWINILTCTWPTSQITPISRSLVTSVSRKLGYLVKMARLQTATSCRGTPVPGRFEKTSWKSQCVPCNRRAPVTVNPVRQSATLLQCNLETEVSSWRHVTDTSPTADWNGADWPISTPGNGGTV